MTGSFHRQDMPLVLVLESLVRMWYQSWGTKQTPILLSPKKALQDKSKVRSATFHSENRLME